MLQIRECTTVDLYSKDQRISTVACLLKYKYVYCGYLWRWWGRRPILLDEHSEWSSRRIILKLTWFTLCALPALVPLTDDYAITVAVCITELLALSAANAIMELPYLDPTVVIITVLCKVFCVIILRCTNQTYIAAAYVELRTKCKLIEGSMPSEGPEHRLGFTFYERVVGDVPPGTTVAGAAIKRIRSSRATFRVWIVIMLRDDSRACFQGNPQLMLRD